MADAVVTGVAAPSTAGTTAATGAARGSAVGSGTGPGVGAIVARVSVTGVASGSPSTVSAGVVTGSSAATATAAGKTAPGSVGVVSATGTISAVAAALRATAPSVAGTVAARVNSNATGALTGASTVATAGAVAGAVSHLVRTPTVSAAVTLGERLAREIRQKILDPANAPVVPSIPSVATDDVGALRRALGVMKTALDLREGRSGSVLDKHLTMRDLIDDGALTVEVGSQRLGGLTTGALVFGERTTGTLVYYPVPPTPTNLVAASAVKNIILTWDLEFYSNHAYVEVWRSGTDAVGTAVLNGTAASDIYVDSSGVIGTQYYYWIYAVNTGGVRSAVNAVAGTPAMLTATNLLEVLSGQVTESQLYQNLGERISRIPDIEGNLNSLAQAVTQQSITAYGEIVQRTLLQTRLGANEAAVETEASIRSTQTGGLLAQYTVKIDVNGNVAGYGLASEATAAGITTSAFGVRADRFYVAAPTTFSQDATPTATATGNTWYAPTAKATKRWDGSAWVSFEPTVPFIVQTVTATINGVSVPPGVYMSGAFIQDGTIVNAKLGNLSVDDAKVVSMSVAKLLAGQLQVGSHIESSNYVAGTSGFHVDYNGFAEFQNATIRGTVYANAGEFASTVRLGAASSFAAGDGIWQGIEASLAKWRVGQAGGKRIQWDGNALEVYGSANNKVLAVSGSSLVVDTPNFGIDAAGNARFNGDISGSSGVFSGSLAAGVLDISEISGSNYTYDTPGTFSVVTMPYTGTVRFTLCGGGGGGGGGGTDRAGLPGEPGEVVTMTITGVPEGAVISCHIAARAFGAGNTPTPDTPPSGNGGGSCDITIDGVTYVAMGGDGGGVSAGGAFGGGGTLVSYFCHNGTSHGLNSLSPVGLAAVGVPGSLPGEPGLTGYPTGVVSDEDPTPKKYVPFLGLAGLTAAVNGGNGVRGAGGGGGAPTRQYVSSRGFYIDPIEGEFGSGNPSSQGGAGGYGFAFIEVFNPNAVVLRNEFLALADNFTTSWRSVFAGSSSGVTNLVGLWGHGLYFVVRNSGAEATFFTTPNTTTVSGATDPIVAIYKASLVT